MNAVQRSLGFLIATALAGGNAVQAGTYREVAVDAGGTVAGRIYFESDFPRPERVQPDRDADVCGIRIRSEQFVVDEDSRGLANVIVSIEGISVGKPFSPAGDSALSQLECRYRPHVSVLRSDHELKITNQDPILHNVHAYLGDETLFNVGFQKFVSFGAITDRFVEGDR